MSRSQEQDGSGQKGRNAQAVPPRPQVQEISFVSFEAGSSSENRKAVRVQAAKASAAARKATIARKLAAQEGEIKAPKGKVSAEGKTPIRVKQESTGPDQKAAYNAAYDSAELRPRDAVPVRQQVRHGKLQNIPTPPLSPTIPAHEALPAVRKRKRSVMEYTESRRNIGAKPTGVRKAKAEHEVAQLRSLPLVPQHRSGSNGTRLSYVAPSANGLSFRETFDATAPPSIVFDRDLPLTPQLTPGLCSPIGASLTRAEPFNAYPIEYSPVYDRLLHHMLTVFAPRGWPALKITHAQGLSWEAWMTQHALAEPALFLVRLLFASGDMIRLGILDPGVSLWLQNRAVQAINEALVSPTRACSDGLILAVGRIALHESMYGDRAAANAMHRPAQRRMIDMRGGMRGLGFPKLITRLMRWADRVMAMQGGTARLLPDDEEDDDDRGSAGIAVKGGVRQDVQVLEEWVPNEGKALRRKIEIRDLLE